MRAWLFLILFVPTLAMAEDPYNTHFFAHVGIGYAMTTVEYGVLNRWVGIDKPTSLIVSLLLTNIASIAREAIEAKSNNSKLNWYDVRNGAIGSALSAGTVLVFDF